MQQLNEQQKKIIKTIATVLKNIYHIIILIINFIKFLYKKIKMVCKRGTKLIVYFFIKLLLILEKFIIIILTLSIPIILPIILKILINLRLFDNIDEFSEYLSIFLNNYIIIFILIGIALFIGFYTNEIKNFFKSIKKIYLKSGEKEASFEREILEKSKEEKEFTKELNEGKREDAIEIQKNIIKEIRKIKTSDENEQLTIAGYPINKCKDCNIKEIEEENNKLRNFATYNIINKETRTLLEEIYDEKYITSKKFKKIIVEGYKRRNRKNIKLSNKNIDKIANNKFESIYNGLKFLNIIEPSENDEIIRLTQKGIDFVKKYIDKKEGE